VAIPEEILADYTLPRALDITVRRGDSFRLDLECEDEAGVALNLDAVTGTAEIKDAVDGELVLAFSVSITAAAGLVSITSPVATTALLEWPEVAQACAATARIGVWDVQISHGSDTRTLASGSAYLSRDITQ